MGSADEDLPHPPSARCGTRGFHRQALWLTDYTAAHAYQYLEERTIQAG
jgi:hypothetical protein